MFSWKNKSDNQLVNKLASLDPYRVDVAVATRQVVRCAHGG
ncbi:unnamed protein product [Ectocarpus sp. 8 AP-2014]